MSKLYTTNKAEAVAEIVKKDDGAYYVDLTTGEETGPLAISKDGKCYKLNFKNAANRAWVNVILVDKVLDEIGNYWMPYKESVVITNKPGVHKDPNAKLIPYMTEDDKAEYEAIMADAWTKYDAWKASNKPGTSLEKLQARLEKAKAEQAKLDAEIAAFKAAEENK